MKIDVTQTLKTISGESLKDVDEKGSAIDATLKLAIVNSLLSPNSQEQESGVDKIKRYELAKMVYKADGEVDLTAEDITLIKVAVNKTFPAPIIVGQIYELLEK
jgi:hypothetical protein